MKAHRGCVPAVALAAMLAAGAVAEADTAVPPVGARAFAGTWSLSDAEGRMACDIELGARPSPHGYAIKIPPPCDRALPVQSVTAWLPHNGLIVLLSETGMPVQTFEAVEDGELYKSVGEPMLFLRDERSRPARPSRAKVDMAGRWTLGSVQASYCVLDFGVDATRHGGAVKAVPGCRKEWIALGFTAWRLTEHRLQLLDAGGKPVRSFIQRDPNTFEDEGNQETLIDLWRAPR